MQTRPLQAQQRAPGAQPLRHQGPVDVQARFAEMRTRYTVNRNKANILIIGPPGSGKTFNAARTAPGPVLIHSFDPGGSRGVADFVEEGRVIVDTRFEEEFAHAPTAYRAWEGEYNALKRDRIFDHIGTYVIDSWTRFTSALMNAILKDRGRAPSQRTDLGKDPNIIPEIQDYLVQQKVLEQVLGDLFSLPCNLVILGHQIIEKDDATGRMQPAQILMAGKKFAAQVPALFDEVYFAVSKSTSKGQEYSYITTQQGLLSGRSRLSKGGILSATEPQDLQAIFTKVGITRDEAAGGSE